MSRSISSRVCRWYAATDAKGHYSIGNVPSGTYKLKAWHERVPAEIKEITVPESGASLPVPVTVADSE